MYAFPQGILQYRARQARQSPEKVMCQSCSSDFTEERFARRAGTTRPGRLRDEEREERVGWEGGEDEMKGGREGESTHPAD